MLLPNSVFDALAGEHFAVRRNEWRDIDTGPSKWKVPEYFSGARLHRPYAAVAGVEHHRLLTADGGHRRRALRGVVRADARAIKPTQLTCCFVEAHEAMSGQAKPAPLRLIAPTDDYRTY